MADSSGDTESEGRFRYRKRSFEAGAGLEPPVKQA
jgi:hypothetical protein